ncbi:MAG: cysteine--tRNA ligase [Pseudomonadota bacterium]
MPLVIYNSFSGTKEEFQPLQPGVVGMYVCGITAYDYSHIGHARSAVVFDVIVRHLRRKGYRVRFVRNFTDIDDKIIRRAREEGTDPLALAERFIGEYYKEMDGLGVLRADAEPRATEHMAEIIALIVRLVERGHAYAAGGDVYFAVGSWPHYGELSHKNLEELQAGARVEPGGHKRNPLDFALWKAGKPGEPTWDSPWGPGRPGWHIEFSAMSMKYLGESFDIHGGGKDLVFPHHENERAQSEAATGKPFARYWVHNGFVTIDHEKMSKSLGNFLTIADALGRWHPEALRLFMLSSHYRSPVDFSAQHMGEAEQALGRLYAARAATTGAAEPPVVDETALKKGERKVWEELRPLPERFIEAMDDDFNTARALGCLFDAARAINKLTSHPSPQRAALLGSARRLLAEASEVLGILREDPEVYLERERTRHLEQTGLSLEDLQRLIRERTEARERKDFARSDAIRSDLAEHHGIDLMDTPEGTQWGVKRAAGPPASCGAQGLW